MGGRSPWEAKGGWAGRNISSRGVLQLGQRLRSLREDDVLGARALSRSAAAPAGRRGGEGSGRGGAGGLANDNARI